MTAPTHQASGTFFTNTGGSATVSWPAHQADDVGILLIETTGGAASISVTNWTLLADQRDLSTTGGSRFFVFARRATSSSMTDPTVGALSDHKAAQIFTFRGVDPAASLASLVVGIGGDGFNYGTSAVSTVVAPSVTTTVNDSLVVFCISRPNDDASTTHFGTPSNGNLTGISAGVEGGTTDGNGGGFLMAYGVMATAGSTGTTSISKTSSTIGNYVVVVLPPAASPIIENAAVGTITLTGVNPTPAGTGTASITPAVAAVALTGVAPSLAGTTEVVIAVATAVLTLTGVPLDASSGGLVEDIEPGSLALVGVAPTLAGSGAVTISIPAAVLTITPTALALTGTGSVSNTVASASVAVSATPIALAGTGTASVTIATGAVTLGPVAVGLTGSGAATVAIQPATLTVSAVALAAVGAGSATIAVATGTMTLTGQSLGLAPGPVAVAVPPAAVTLTAVVVVASIVIVDPNVIPVWVRTIARIAVTTAAAVHAPGDARVDPITTAEVHARTRGASR